MVNGSSAELAKERFSSKCLEVVNEERPQVKNIITRETITLLH